MDRGDAGSAEEGRGIAPCEWNGFAEVRGWFATIANQRELEFALQWLN
jgi:hypothetical protein